MTIDQLKKKIKIYDVIKTYLQLSKKGKNYIGLCPFHNDKNPSLSVSIEKNLFKCFTCSAGGDSIIFLKKFLGLNYLDAIIKASELSEINCQEYEFLFKKNQGDKLFQKLYDLNLFINNSYINFLNNDTPTLQILKNKRKLKDDQIKKFKIGYAPKTIEKNSSICLNLIDIQNKQNQTEYNINDLSDAGLITTTSDGKISDFFYNRIVFPICDEYDHVVGFSGRIIDAKNEKIKYVNTPETIIFKKGNILYNLNNLYNISEKFDQLYLVEGFMDVIAFDRINIYNAVATMGTNFSEHQIKLLNKYFTRSKFKKIVLGFDNDDAGIIFSENTAHKLLNHGYEVYILDFLDFKKQKQINLSKDIDEIVNKNNYDELTVLNNPINYFEWFIKKKIINEKFDIEDAIAIREHCLNYFFIIKNNEIFFKKIISVEYAKKIIESVFKIFDCFNDKKLNENQNLKKQDYLTAIYDEKRFLENFNDKIKKNYDAIDQQFYNSNHLEFNYENCVSLNNNLHINDNLKQMLLYFFNYSFKIKEIKKRSNLNLFFDGFIFRCPEAKFLKSLVEKLFILCIYDKLKPFKNNIEFHELIKNETLTFELTSTETDYLNKLNFKATDFFNNFYIHFNEIKNCELNEKERVTKKEKIFIKTFLKTFFKSFEWIIEIEKNFLLTEMNQIATSDLTEKIYLLNKLNEMIYKNQDHATKIFAMY